MMVHNSDRGRGSPGCTGGRGTLQRGQLLAQGHVTQGAVQPDLSPALHQCTTLSLQCKLQIECYKTPKHKFWPVWACTTLSLQIIFLNTEHVSEKGNARKWHKPAGNCWWKNLKHFVEPVTPGIQEYSFTCRSHRLKCIECNTTHTLKCIKHIEMST